MKTNLFSKNTLVRLKFCKTFFFCLLFLLMGAKVLGQYSYTFTSSQFTASNQTKLLGTVNWTLVNDGNFYGYDATKGQQIGSAANPAELMTLSTSGISGTITSVKVTTSGASSVVSTIGVKVGTTSFSPASTSITATSTEYTFTGSASGAIVITWNNSSAKALYIKKLDVAYSSTSITTTTPVSGSPFCVSASGSASVSVPYTISGTFTSGNVFTAQLSDASGSFTSATNIGTRTATTAGTISATIPAGTASGTGYKIRVVANNPSITGSETAAFTINLRSSSIAPTTAQNISTGVNGTTLTSTATGATSRQWKYSAVSGGPYTNDISGATGSTYIPNFSSSGTYYVICDATFAGCGAITSNEVRINVTSPVTYTLTYNGNDNTSDPSTVPANDSFTGGQNPGIILANPLTLAKTGYAFASWYSIPNGISGGVINTPGTNYGPAPMPSNNITLYARWKFTVAYDSNGGTGTIANQTSYYNGTAGVQSGTLILNNGSGFTRTGYTFGGWKTNSAGTVADYNAGDTYNHAGSSSDTKILYAHWIANAPTFNVSPAALSGFTYVEGYGPSATQSFNLTGSDLQNTSGDPVELVTINDNFEIAESASGPWSHAIVMPSAYTGAQKTFYVRLKAGLVTSTSYTDTVLISGGSAAEASFAEVALTGSVTACLAPVTQSVISSFSAVGINGMTVNLTSGNGTGRVVVINTGNTFTDPSATLPVANNVYGGIGEQVIYAGTGNTVAVTGLSPSTNYYFRVYEYNLCSGTTYLYNTTASANNPRSQMTACDVPTNPNGEITQLENPACGSATLVYEHGTTQPQSGVSYYWQTTATGTSTANPVTSNYSVTLSGDYYVRAYNGNCWSAGSYKTNTAVVISTSATISTQPADQSIAAGATATFTVAASGTAPFTYQWQESPTGLAGTWTNAATTASLSLTNVSLNKNGYKYRVIVSNSCGSKTSNIVTLTVSLTPVSIWSNDITATNPSATNPYTTGDNSNANITVSGIKRGTGLTAASASGRFSASGWSTAALDENDYFEFKLTPNSNYKIDFDSFTYTSQISGGASNHAFRSSLDGFTSNIGTPTVSGTAIDLSGTAYQNVTEPITFRFYTYGVSASTRTFSINDFDFTGNVLVSCTPASISAFPNTGPANTIVTITGSDFTAGSTVKFGTATATVEYVSATKLKAIVPANADGNIIVDTALSCDSQTAFTLIKSDITNCEAPLAGSGSGSTYASDLIIYEVYDENGGSGGVVSIYNGTNASVNLDNYSFYRAGDYGTTYSNYGILTGNLASGQLAVIGVNASLCGIATTGNGSISGGFNDNDGFRLMKGAVIIDDVKAPNYAGYYMKRKNEYLSPKTTFVDNEWTTSTLDTGECLPASQVAQVPVVKTAPIVNTQPSYSLICDVADASLAITASEGYVGGNPLTYQWYVLGTSGSWTAVSDNSIYSGANSQTLNINNINGLDSYQYYCQVRENTQTCFTATSAAQIKEANNTWSINNTWSNGTPVLGSNIIIAGNYDSQINGTLDVCELTVSSTGTMRVRANTPIKVKKKIVNQNTSANSFVVESDANLIQTDNIVNEGNVKVERQVTNMNNISSQMDYVYWSSPVNGQMIKGQTGFSPNTPATGFLQYTESTDKFAVTSDVNFITGKGYAIRAESGTGFNDGYSKTYNFSGVPNNGDLQFQNLKWTNATHGYNLIGNPYPSNIDFDLLHSLNSTKIYSSAFFWTNNTFTPSQMGSGYAGNNYAIYNVTGGVPATYDVDNPNYSVAPNGKIKVGQAFIVQAKQTGKDLPLDFKNTIRVTDSGTFYQKGTAKNRFWLTLTSPNNLVNTILLGYIPGASNDYETDFDGELFAVGSDSFYSVLGAKKLAIQGKSDNFSTDDVITLGNVFSINGNYTISLKTGEGIFDGSQSIYLRDKLLNKYIDLRSQSSYTFEAAKGTNNTRFEIVYKEGTLDINQDKKSEFIVYRNMDNFVIRSSKKLGNVEVYDSGGKLVRKVTSRENILVIDASGLPNGLFIIKAENSGELITRKIIK